MNPANPEKNHGSDNIRENPFHPWSIHPTGEKLNRCKQMNGANATTAQ
jgi:hypothetical protein